MVMYTVKEAAENLKVTEETITKWLRDGRFPHAKKNGKWLIPECCLVGHSPDGKTSAEETPAETHKEETPVVTIQVDGVGAVEANDEVQDLIRKKAKAVLTRQISEIEAGYVTTEEVDAFRAQQANLNERDKATIALERDLADLSSQETDLDIREEQTTALEAELDKRDVVLKKSEYDLNLFHNQYQLAVDIANEQHTKILDLVRFLISVRETLQRTMKGARGSISPKDANALIWKHLDVWNAIYGSWIVDDKGLVLIDGEPVPSWFQEIDFKGIK